MDSQSLLYESADQAALIADTAFRQYLTVEEELQICQQFHSTWRLNSQVMWSGMLREHAQKWADEHNMVTLTTAMAPLMAPENPLCLKRQKSSSAWKGGR